MLLTFFLFILSLQLRMDIKVKDKAVEHVLNSWSNYIDSMKVESKNYQDTIKSLRLEINNKETK